MSKVLKDVSEAVKKKPSLKDSASALAKHLKRHHPDYSQYHDDHIRKLVRQANDPKHNLRLRYPEMSDPMLREVRAFFERDKIEWTPALEKEQSDLLSRVKKALDEEHVKWGLPRQYEQT